MRASVIDYCATIGSDPLLVQGAGGNVSWKEADTLWVKASGTWLADAKNKDIFVPVELKHLQAAMDEGDFEVEPRTPFNSTLRPSIETMLHALLPHRIVVHVHSVEILANLVRANYKEKLAEKLGPDVSWISVGYQKPGADLARAIKEILRTRRAADAVFLANHGVVVGGNDIDEVDRRLRMLIERLTFVPLENTNASDNRAMLDLPDLHGYRVVDIPQIQKLAIDPRYFDRVKKYWALYPDHVVFLGPMPVTFSDIEAFCAFREFGRHAPELVFIEGVGVLERERLSPAKCAYLLCYCDVLSRQSADAELMTLSDDDIRKLIDWDAEKFRQSLDLR